MFVDGSSPVPLKRRRHTNIIDPMELESNKVFIFTPLIPVAVQYRCFFFWSKVNWVSLIFLVFYVGLLLLCCVSPWDCSFVHSYGKRNENINLALGSGYCFLERFIIFGRLGQVLASRR